MASMRRRSSSVWATLTKYSKGTSGVMKIKKEIFGLDPLAKGDIIAIDDWTRRPQYRYLPAEKGVRHKPQPIPGQDEFWILTYRFLKKAAAS